MTWARVTKRSSAGARIPAKGHELLEIIPVGSPGVRIVDVREPLGFGWHVGELGEFGCGQGAAGEGAHWTRAGLHCSVFISKLVKLWNPYNLG